MVDGVTGQQRFLVLDALRLGLVLVFVLLTQSCIDCTKDLLHLLQGVTARYYDTLWAATRQEIILNAFADKTAKAFKTYEICAAKYEGINISTNLLIY